MGYLPLFDADVFISYAHFDNSLLGDEKRGWVAELHDELTKLVCRQLGANPVIWRDEAEILKYEDFKQKIFGSLGKAATLLCVLSKSYLSRPWCAEELEEFTLRAEKTLGLRIGDKVRIFKVQPMKISHSALEPFPSLQGTGSYEFYGPDPLHSERVREFRPLYGEPFKTNFYTTLYDLAVDIAGLLEEMKKKSFGQIAPAEPPLAFYLAKTTSDLREQADEIRRDFRDRGYLVLPEGDLPENLTDLTRKVREDLQRSALSVHLIGAEYGFIPEGQATLSHPRIQHQLAIEQSSMSGMVRLVWMPSSKSTDSRQKEFIDYLATDTAAQTDSDLLQTPLDELKAALLTKLVQVRQPKVEQKSARPDLSATAKLLRIYIICDQLDLDSGYIAALQDYLFNKGYDCLLPSECKDERAALQEHNDFLHLCDACIIFYGGGSEQWVNAKRTDLIKLQGGREGPPLPQAVCIAAPDTPAKKRFRTHDAVVIRAGESFASESFMPFLDQLAVRAAGAKA